MGRDGTAPSLARIAHEPPKARLGVRAGGRAIRGVEGVGAPLGGDQRGQLDQLGGLQPQELVAGLGRLQRARRPLTGAHEPVELLTRRAQWGGRPASPRSGETDGPAPPARRPTCAVPSASKADLLDAIRAALHGVVHSGYGTADVLDDIYEAYVWTRVLEAARRLGWAVSYSTPAGHAPTTLLLRRGPGVIYSSAPFTFAVLSKRGRPTLEVHLGVMVTGRSGVAHECDVLVLTEAAAQAARNAGTHPTYREVVLQAECKFYTGDLPLGLARGMRGLSADCSLGGLGGLVTNATRSVSVGQASLLVSTMEETPRLADLRALDAAGNPFGPSLTLDGAILPGFFGYVSAADAKGQALYLQDHWELLDNRLKLDLGVRWQSLDINLVRRDRNVVTNLTPPGVTPGSNADTTADDEISLPGAPRVFDGDFDAFGWSVGGNYSIRDSFAVYGLVSRSFRLPSLEDINEFRIGAAPVVNGETVDLEQIERIWQYEAGLRYQTPSFDTSAAVFYNEFEHL